MINRINITLLCFCASLVFSTCKIVSQTKPNNSSSTINANLVTGFITPPDSIKPYVYWYWISDNISKEGITKDLEAMARVGIGEAFIGNIGLETVPYGNVKVLSDEWWTLTKFAITEGQRLGVNIGVFNTPGWSQSGGPWVPANQAMRYLKTTEIKVEGGKRVNIKLPALDSESQDMAIIAYPIYENLEIKISELKPTVKFSSPLSNASNLVDGNLNTSIKFSDEVKSKGLNIFLETTKDFTSRSIVIYPDTIKFSADVEVQVFTNGNYQTIRKFVLDRTNDMISVGPDVYAPVSFALPEFTSKKYKLILSNLKNPDRQIAVGGIKEIILSNYPKLENFAEKQMAKMLQTPDLSWNEYLWKPQMVNGDAGMFIESNKVLNLTEFLNADKVLNWDAPAGNWTIKRVTLSPTGAKNTPASPEATGYEVDKINSKYLKNHFDSYIGKLLKEIPAENRKSFKHVVIDSYEVGPQNWTEGMAKVFKEKYGYDPILWLPVLSGNIVNSAEESDRFLWDLRRLVADLVANEYAGGLRKLSEQNGLQLWLENYGHWGFPSEFLTYGGQTNDIAGEFWVEGTLGDVECRAASSAAHIYGKNRVFAESYTGGGLPFERYPGYLKKRGDWSFTEGINHVLLHVYIHQAYEDKNPGMNAWFGTEFNRKNTWFEQSKTWIDYQRRSMFMLQQGKPVNDVCYFIGEDAPKLSGGRNPEIPKGYSYDYINAEVILKSWVENNTLMLPGGMSYKLMVLPPLETITPQLLAKIKDLVNSGLVILGPKPSRSPSLQNYPYADQEVQNLANQLWGNDKNEKISKSVGKGKVMQGYNLTEALNMINLEKDLDIPQNQPVLFTHRKTKDQDIYFITNQSAEKLNFNAKFRVNGKQAQVFDATNGTIRNLPQFTQSGNITTVPLQFAPYESYFIVFSDDINTNNKGENFPEPSLIATIDSPWLVSFEQGKRGPANPITFNSLTDWSTHVNDSIKYFSGTATYTNTFKATKIEKGEEFLLDLGNVGNMAKVKINGKYVGGLWTAPWRINITPFLTKGNNAIEIEVVNLWVNRMIGDSKLPLNERKTWAANNYFNPTDPLKPSGLLQPVKLFKIKY